MTDPWATASIGAQGGSVFVSSTNIRSAAGRTNAVPPTQGDKFHDKRTGRIIEQKDRRIKLWRLNIATEIQFSDWIPIMHGPILCVLVFKLPRPARHYRGRSGQLRDGAPQFHHSKPDIDKLARAVLDALTQCGAIGDDAQISVLTATKIYADTPADSGVHITCRPLTDQDTP